MFGPPKDTEGQCNARLFLGDDYGDNTVTFRCTLKPGHQGHHSEQFFRSGTVDAVDVTWAKDERGTPADPIYTYDDERDDEEGADGADAGSDTAA